MRFARTFIACQIDNLNLRCSYRVTARLRISIIDLYVDAEHGVGARALQVALCLGYDAYLFTERKQLLDVVR